MSLGSMKMLASRLAQVIMVPLLLAVPFITLKSADAAFIQDRRLVLGTSEVSAVTTHEAVMALSSVTPIGSIVIEYCDNSPFPGTPCTIPAGIDVSGVSLSSEAGEVGFGIHPNTNGNTIVLTRPVAPVTTISPALSRYLFTDAVNPSTEGTLYVRYSTYGTTDGTGAIVDEGGVAISLTTPITVGAYVPPVLLFCVGTSIPTNNCSSAVGDGIDFGEFTPSTTSAGTIQMLAATNGFGGYTITSTGTTMTSGNNTISPINPRGPSQPGQSQFGLNLRDNSSPNVGANVSGAGTGVPDPDYNVPNRYFYSTNDVIARSTKSTRINKFTASYIVNIGNNQNAGVYATTITFTALASF